ncbi:type I DNA topoisomerase [Brooklawnia cerclae]
MFATSHLKDDIVPTTTRRLVIVESPTKANSIAGYLGDGYVVESSRGHVRDLPTNAAEVPAKYKGQSWARTGVNVDDDFAPLYVVSPDKKATIRRLKELLADSDELYLATDEDREGEAIAWHLLQELKPKVPVKRMVFHEITRDAIRKAVESPRDLDLDLVDAQETRRILDRLYGYEVSPVLWKKVMPRLSAGRVQSVATRLVVDRERERIAFRSAVYWDLIATLDAGSGASPRLFDARLTGLDEWRVARGQDFDASGQLVNDAFVLNESGARALAAALPAAAFAVGSVEAKPYTRRPSAPFRTTTLQQEAGRKLGFTTDRTMRVAQELYESGFITYMRTDSVALSDQAVAAARTQARSLYGDEYVPAAPRQYASKVKSAQEAHEAIRPAGDTFRTPKQTGLSGDGYRLYELVWQRTLASQMADAHGQTMTVRVSAELAQRLTLSDDVTSTPVRTATFTASGRTITFPGFMKAYAEEVSDDQDENQAKLPKLEPEQALDLADTRPEDHRTKPPARYTEPSLIAKLEEMQIGRPSTYASIIRTITARDYVYKKGTALVPTWLAFAVTRLLVEHFPRLVDYTFTAELEDRLDEIANGDAKRLEVLGTFFFGPQDNPHAGLQDMVTNLGDIDAKGLSTFPIGDPEAGINVRVGRYGTYVEDAQQNRANVPEDLPPDELTLEKARELLATPNGEERELGTDPATGHEIVARTGRYGPYVTEVLAVDESVPKSKRPKPRTASLFKTMTLETITLDDALRLLDLPRVVGADADGEEISAHNGRYGPYIKRGDDSRTLPDEESLFTVTLDEALKLLAEPRTRGRRAAAAPLRELGADPATGKPLVVKDGRFGPYVTDGEYNATVPRSQQVESLTLTDAAELMAAKRAKGPAPAKRPRKTTGTSTARKASTKKATTRKT